MRFVASPMTSWMSRTIRMPSNRYARVLERRMQVTRTIHLSTELSPMSLVHMAFHVK
jgi:hypothetical protein